MMRLTASEKNEKLVVDLNGLESMARLSEKKLFYEVEFNEFKEQIIKNTKANLENIRNDKAGYAAYVHKPCYFVNGERGSGKSTILYALEEALCKSNDGVKLKLLAHIDPTELSDAENFFIHILGHVQKCLNDNGRCDCYGSDFKMERKRAYETLRRMSRGLALLAKKTENIEHLSDAEFFVQDSIIECISSANLKEKFAELVDVLCKMSGVDALLVTVDDGDMNFNKCIEVFETVRKYLLTPRMVYVFAGDQKLYTMVVRGMQMRHFGKYSLDYDEERKNQIVQLLDNLEEQYIIKLFPALNRINLSDFGGLLKKKFQIEHSGVKGFKPIEVEKFIQHLEKLNVVYDSETVINFMSILSARSALQLLEYWVRNMELSSKSGKRDMKCFCDGVQRVVSHALIKYGVDVNALHRQAPYGLLHYILLHIQNLKQGVSGLCMCPGRGDNLLQMVSFYLSSVFSLFVNSRSDIITCFLNVFPYYDRYGGNERDREKLLNHLSVKPVPGIGAECTDMMLRQKNWEDVKPFANGVVPVFSREYTDFSSGVTRISFDDYMLELMEAVYVSPTLENIMYFLAIYHLLSRTKMEELTVSCLSVYNILSTVQRLLACDAHRAETAVRSILFELKEIAVDIRDAEKFSKLAPTLSKEKEFQSYDKKEFFVSRFVRYLDNLEVEESKKVVDEIVKSLNTAEKLRYSTRSLYVCWTNFMRKCSEISDAAVIRASRSDDLVRADILIKEYLIAFDNALYNSLVPENGMTALLLFQFPLCHSIVVPPKNLSDKLGMVNIAKIELQH